MSHAEPYQELLSANRLHEAKIQSLEQKEIQLSKQLEELEDLVVKVTQENASLNKALDEHKKLVNMERITVMKATAKVDAYADIVDRFVTELSRK